MARRPDAKQLEKRRWFLRPLWRDPSFYFCFAFAGVCYAAMFPSLWSRAHNLFTQGLVIAYFFLVWFLVCAVVSIPIRTIRGFWQGSDEAGERHRDPEHKPTTGQAALRVGGRMVGRRMARVRRRDTDE